MVRTGPATWAEVDTVIRTTSDPSAYALGSTSSVVAPSIVPAEWYVNALLVPHEALRYVLLMLERSVQPQYFQPVRAWKVQRFFHFYRDIVLGFVDKHHTAEDVTYFPWIRTRAPLPDRLNDEHEGLHAKLEAISATEHTLQSCKSEEEKIRWATALREQVEGLGEFMREHLTEEEVLIVPALRDNFTQAEHDAMIMGMAAHIPPAGRETAIALCCAGQLRAGGEPLLNKFLSELFPQAVEMWKGVLRPHIDAEMAYLNTITLDQEDEPPFDRSTLFVIEEDSKH